jgi:hypothetical protein
MTLRDLPRCFLLCYTIRLRTLNETLRHFKEKGYGCN